MTDAEFPNFKTVTEVATIMRVSKMTVYRLLHGGELQRIRVGRSFRIPEAAVQSYLRSAGYTLPEGEGEHAGL